MTDTLHSKLDEILRLLKGDKEETIKYKLCIFCGRRHKREECRFDCKSCEETHSRYVDCKRKKFKGEWYNKGREFEAALWE